MSRSLKTCGISVPTSELEPFLCWIDSLRKERAQPTGRVLHYFWVVVPLTIFFVETSRPSGLEYLDKNIANHLGVGYATMLQEGCILNHEELCCDMFQVRKK
jgi:hypothetical protein